MTSTTLLAMLLAASAVTIATIVGWMLTAIASPFVLRCNRVAASSRVWLLAQVRLLPLAAVAILVPVQIQAFSMYEVGRPESAGVLLFATATCGFLLAGEAVRRAAMAWRDTARVAKEWRATATPVVVERWNKPAWAIESPFPIVAVAGVWRPQLFVARQVLSRCSAIELASVGAHEAAHAAAGDNLVRLLFELTPGARLCRRLADPLERAWAMAAEEAADVVARDASSALHLASALTKVARLAAGSDPSSTLVSALIGGADLSTRVHRLLDVSTPTPRSRAARVPAVALLGTAILLQTAPVSRGIHELFELLVRQG